jgi:hypothetical protein
MTSSLIRVGRSASGLFATKPIKRGGYIATYRDRHISTEKAERREARDISGEEKEKWGQSRFNSLLRSAAAVPMAGWSG